MKKIVLLALIITWGIKGYTQQLSLTPAEITRLKKLVAADESARNLFTPISRMAAGALGNIPNPIDTLHSEGRLKGDPQKTATANALRDMQKMYALALLYRMEGNKKYLDKATEFLKAWATVNQPNGDPIDDTNLDGAIIAYDLLKNELATGDKKLIDSWLNRTALAEINSPKMKPGRSTATNNWNSHRLKVVGEIAWALNDTALQRFTIEGLKTQVARNLNADGSGIDFKLRDALHYHVYSLEPLLELAIILKRATGTDYYTYQSATGSSIKKSVDWLMPYITGEKTHEEYVNTTVKFDRDRAKNNEAGFKPGTFFKPASGIDVLALAAWFEPQLTDTLRRVKQSTETYPEWQSVLNKVSAK